MRVGAVATIGLGNGGKTEQALAARNIEVRSQRRILQWYLGAVVGTALDDGLVEQVRCARRGQLAHDAVAAGGLTENRHVLRVAIELIDIGLHPFQCQLLILQAEVGIPQRFMGQEAQGAQAVIEGYHHHALLHQPHRIVTGAAGAIDKGAAVDPDHDRILTGRFRRVDVEEQAVLVQTRFTEGAGILGAATAEGLVQLNGVGVSRREGGRGKALGHTIANATEYPHAILLDTHVVTLLGGDLQRILR